MTMPSGLTRQQSKVLDFIRTYITEHGYSPTYAEIAQALQIVSQSSVHRHVHSLIRRGALAALDRSARSLMLCGDGALKLYLPPELDRAVRSLAEQTGTTPEAVAIEALRDCLLLHRSHLVSCETPLSGVGHQRPPETRGPVTAPRHSPIDPRINLSSEIIP